MMTPTRLLNRDQGRSLQYELLPIPGLAFASTVLVTVMVASAVEAGVRKCTPVPTATFDFQLENDFKEISLFHQSDDEYTNGIRFRWSQAILNGANGPEHSVWPFRPRADRCFSVSYTFGQNLYTPKDLLTPDRILTDRPYAAWLYVGYSISAFTLTNRLGPMTGVRTLQILDVNVGVIGPAAIGQWAQNHAHRWFNVRVYDGGPIKIAQGWPNQLPNEPAFFGEYKRDDKWTEAFVGESRVFDLVTTARGALGTVFIFAGAGARARVGYGLQDSVIGRPTTIAWEYARLSDSKLAWVSKLVPTESYVFGAVEGRAVARNEFLDGTAFRDTPQSVEKRRGVGDVEIGGVVGWPVVKVTYRTVVRTSEYPLHPDNHYFGSIDFTVWFKRTPILRR